MKRLHDNSIEKSMKKVRSNPATDIQQQWENLPADVWGEITGQFKGSQGMNLISTSSFFYSGIHSFKQPIYLGHIQNEIFDYSDQSELNTFIDLPADQTGFTKLKNHFANKLEAVKPEILELQFRLDFSTHFEIDDSSNLFEPEQTDVSDFLKIIGTAAREGNRLILKELQKSLPVYMEHCINDVDVQDMTPLAYAAALDRDNIFLELLSQCVEPFKPVVKYDLGADIVFSMRSIHILALRSNKNLLLTILRDYFDTLVEVFDKNYEDALWDILHNQVKFLEEKLDEDESLLEAVDDGSWTLAQWASCFPESLDCLQLLIDKKAVINGEDSPPVTYIACAANNILALKILKAQGQSIEPLKNGNNLLHLSAYLGHDQITFELIKNCYQDVNLPNSSDKTALDLAHTSRFEVEMSPDMLKKKMLCAEILLNYNAEETYAPGPGR